MLECFFFKNPGSLSLLLSFLTLSHFMQSVGKAMTAGLIALFVTRFTIKTPWSVSTCCSTSSVSANL